MGTEGPAQASQMFALQGHTWVIYSVTQGNCPKGQGGDTPPLCLHALKDSWSTHKGSLVDKESPCKQLSVQIREQGHVSFQTTTPGGVGPRPSWAGQLNQPLPHQPENSSSFPVNQRKKVSGQG